MISEIAVIVKDDERTLTKKFLQYEPYTVTDDDPTLNEFIKQTLEEFKGKADEVKLKIMVRP